MLLAIASASWLKREWQKLNKTEAFFVSVFVAAAVLLIIETMRKALYPTNQVIIQKFAEAIASAEGFGIPGAVPTRLHNPGDVTRDFTGKGLRVADQGIIEFATDADGWDNLRWFVGMMFDGSSGIYAPSMSIAEVAGHYAGDSSSWANNVAGYLGVSTSTRLSELT